jgi:hypothetical protein
VPANVAFEQFFFGPVGPHGCYSFSAFDLSRTSTGADVVVRGLERRGVVCTQEPVNLDGRALSLGPVAFDPFILRVFQPDGTVLTRTIRIQ